MLLVRHVDLRLSGGGWTLGPDVGHDTDDRHERHVVEAALNAAADRVGPGKASARERLVDDDDEGSLEPVPVAKVAAAGHRHVQRLEVLGRHHGEERLWRAGAGLLDRLAAV